MNRDEFYIALEANRTYVKEHKDELKHHGVKGQQWGVRQYQNPDGTLTELGRIHYGRELQRHTDAKVAYETAADDVATRRPWSAVGGGLFGGYTGSIIGLGAGEVAGSAGFGALVGGVGGAAVGALLGIGVSKLSERVYRKNSEKAQAKVDELVRQYGDLELNSEHFALLTKQALERGQAAKPVHVTNSVSSSLSQPELEKRMKELAKSKDFYLNGRKHDMEFLEKMDNPVHVDHLSDGSLDRLWAMKNAGASWNQLYAEKDRLERLEANMKS